MPISVVNQITERIVKGVRDGIDSLTFTALSIVRVGKTSSAADFLANVDYKLTAGAVDWSPVGAEPAPGQEYFATYTFLPPSSFKGFNQISDEMEVNMRALEPRASTQIGSVTRNLHIDLQATQLAPLYAAIQRVSLIQSLENIADFEGTELDEFGANFQSTRLATTRSTGQATFEASNVAAEPILIPQGTRLSTLSTASQTPIFFRTLADATIVPGDITATVDIESEQVGIGTNVGSSTIVTLATQVLGISTVENQSPTTGGRDQESDEDYRDRIKDNFLANDADTRRGIKRRALDISNVIDALVVGAGEVLLIRGGGIGGKVDLYIQAEAGLSRTGTHEEIFNSVDIVLPKQPVSSISSVLVNGTPLGSGNFELVKDVSAELTESTKAQDALRITGGALNGDTINVTFIHNAVLDDVQTFFNSEENDVPARDLLARSATQVFIDVSVSIKLSDGATFETVESAIIDAVATDIDNRKMGARIRYATVFDLVKETTGVDDVRPLEILARQGESRAETIQLENNEFPTTGTISVTEFE